MASRRCPSRQRAPADAHDPSPSGPRSRIESRVATNSSSEGEGALDRYAKMPFMPHMYAYAVRNPLRPIDLEMPAK